MFLKHTTFFSKISCHAVTNTINHAIFTILVFNFFKKTVIIVNTEKHLWRVKLFYFIVNCSSFGSFEHEVFFFVNRERYFQCFRNYSLQYKNFLIQALFFNISKVILCKIRVFIVFMTQK